MDSPNISIRIRRHESLPCRTRLPQHTSATHRATGSNNSKQHNTTTASTQTHNKPNTNTTRSPPRHPHQHVHHHVVHRNAHTHGNSACSLTIGRRLFGATKNNPYVGSFRHAPPTSLRSMCSSPLTVTSTHTHTHPHRVSSSLSSSSSFSVPTTMKNSPYVGWFRHAPPSLYFSSYATHNKRGTAGTNTRNNKPALPLPALVQQQQQQQLHTINPDTLQELNRWHHRLTSMLLGVETTTTATTSPLEPSKNNDSNETTASPPLLLGRIVNGRLLGGNGSSTTNNNSNDFYQPHDDSRILTIVNNQNNTHGYNAILSRLTSWLLFPLVYADNYDECECSYDDYVLNKHGNDDGIGSTSTYANANMPCCKQRNNKNKNNTSTTTTTTSSSGLKFLVSSPALVDDRSIGIDSDDDSYDNDDDDCSSMGSCDYNPTTTTEDGGCEREREHDCRRRRVETEREFAEMTNITVSEIAEARYAHRLLDERLRRRRRSNSDAATVASNETGQGLSPPLHHPHSEAVGLLQHAYAYDDASEYSYNEYYNHNYCSSEQQEEDDEIRHRQHTSNNRLDYEITQMDIARMTRNASRHLDVDSILTLPTISYRKKKKQQRLSTTKTPTSTNAATDVRSKTTNKDQQQQQQKKRAGEQSYHHVCTPIYEDGSSGMLSCSTSSTNDKNNETMGSEEDGWSFLMVSGVNVNNKSSMVNNDSVNNNYNTNGNNNSNTNEIVASSSNSNTLLLSPIDDHDDESSRSSSSDDVCVICLEAFQEGDRLRVLPCDHSFHVGCIDRWLSGSHSHNECFTVGCPTCKKRPYLPPPPRRTTRSSAINNNNTEDINVDVDVDDEAEEIEDNMSGSLPSWAFANLGSVMAMSSGDILSDN